MQWFVFVEGPLLLPRGGRWKPCSQLDGEDVHAALCCWAPARAWWDNSSTAKAFRWHSWELSPRPATAIKLMELWQQLWLISGRNPLECSLSLQHHLHFSQSGWIFCRDRAQAVSFAPGSPCKQTFYLAAPARSFAAGCLFLASFFFSPSCS